MASTTRPQARRGPSGAWNRLKPGPSDPLDAYGLPSKGETRLHDPKAQESYYTKIVERYMKYCSSNSNLEEAFNSLSVASNAPLSIPGRPPLVSRPSETERPDDLPNILLAMRKLREAILAVRRTDSFAQKAYIFIIHASVLTRSWESYLPALSYLLDSIHRHTPLSQPLLQEFVAYQILDLACRQNELLEAYKVRLEWKCKDRKVAMVLKSLVHDDWVRFWRCQKAVDGYQRSIMEFAAERTRMHALKCLGRGYLSADKNFVERSGGARWEDLVKGGVGWQLQDGATVVIRKPKAKT